MLLIFSMSQISVTIITLNEERNIANALRSVSWADDILVVDSGSTDRTVEIAMASGARVIYNPWPGYGQQKNFAQSKAKHDWVLNVDADEVVSPELANEMREVLEKVSRNELQANGFFFPRKTYYMGRWIKHGGWYPNYLVRLVDRRHGYWTEPNVHEELKVRGQVVGLASPINHYAFSSIQEQILTNLHFSHLGSQELKKSGQKESFTKLVLKPFGKFLETYFLKRGFLDGLPGLIISINASHSMFLKYAYLFESRIRNEAPHHRQ